MKKRRKKKDPRQGTLPLGRFYKQMQFLAQFGMPISRARKLVRIDGRKCLRCLSRPRVPGKSGRGTRCVECVKRREEDNKGRKR